MKSVLHVGCGSATIANMPAGFRDGSWRELRFDIDPAYSVDFVGTMLDMNVVADDSVDALYSSHNIEHVDAHQIDGVLREFRRVIKPDGFVVVTCPDLEAVAKHMAEGRQEDPLNTSPSGRSRRSTFFTGMARQSHGAKCIWPTTPASPPRRWRHMRRRRGSPLLACDGGRSTTISG